MRLSVEEAACRILESVQQRLPNASIEYESFGGTHYFHIEHLGARFNVRFPEAALRRKQQAQLQTAIDEVVEHVISLSRRTHLKQFNSMLMLSFMDTNMTNVRPMADPTVPVGGR